MPCAAGVDTMLKGPSKRMAAGGVQEGKKSSHRRLLRHLRTVGESVAFFGWSAILESGPFRRGPMCDYSLAGLPNRLAVEGEQLLVYRFTTGAMGLASSSPGFKQFLFPSS